MKKLLTSFLLTLVILLSINIHAQINRRDNKKSVAYKANYQRMASGSNAFHSLEIRGGTLWAWGWNNYGQIGDSTTTDRNYPKQIGIDTKWISISANGVQSLGLKADGTIWAWGGNFYGQLGDSTTTDRTSPVRIGTDNKWISITAGRNFSSGLKSDGTLWGWGWNGTGQLGDGTFTNRNSPVQIGIDNKWVNISSGGSHSLGLKSDGTLWAWGNDTFGQLGDGMITRRNSPFQIGLDNKWVSIAAGIFHSFALKSDGTIWAWGSNNAGRLGDGTTTDRLTPVQIGTDHKWVSIAAADNQSFGLKTDGTLWTWGFYTMSPVQIGTDNNWVSIEIGWDHRFCMKSDGTLWAWGSNNKGQLGDSTNTDKSSPVQISSENKWLTITAGYANTLGLKTEGTLWAWGKNQYGQLGDSTTVIKTTPVKIGIANNWVSIAAAVFHTHGLKSDGTLWAWGANPFGALGDGTTTQRIKPIQIGSDTKWVSIAPCEYHTLGLKSDGTLWAWGNNQYGELGDGTTTDRHSPVQIGTDNKWVSISTGSYYSLGLKSDGTVWAWGFNNYGQLGDGTTTERHSPTQIGTDNKWVSIVAHEGGHALGLKSDGTLWSWGYNSTGQLGDGTYIDKHTPVQIGSDNKWISLAASYAHSFGLKSDGTLWAWGQNGSGQLGDGTNTNRNSPVYIGSSTNWVNIIAGNWHSVGLKSERDKFCATGENSEWQLGDNTTTDKNTFVCNTNCIPPAANAGNAKTICPGDSTYIGDTSVNGNTYSWNSKPIGFTSTSSEPIVKPIVTTTYYLTEKITATGCDKLDSVKITVNPPPNVNGGLDRTICNGDSTFIGTFAIFGSTYAWTSSPVGFTSTSVRLKVSPAITTFYYLKETITATGCSKTDTVKVTVIPSPSANVGSPKTICQGDTVSIGAIAISGHKYSWSSSIGGYTGVNPNPTLTPFTTTVYYLTETDTTTGCSKSDSVTITVNPLPPAIVGSPKTICSGDSASLGASALSGNTYSWTSIPAGFTSSSSNIIVKPTTTTFYYLKETITATGCYKIDAVKITVLPPPTANAGTSKTICKGLTTLGANAVIGNTYSWTSSPPGFTSNIADPNVNPDSTTVYYLTETITATGCSKSDSIIIIVNPLTPAIVGPAKTICYGDSTSIGTPSLFFGNTFNWFSSPAGFTSVSPNPTVNPIITTTYILTETITATGCNKTDSVKVTVNPLPVAGVGSNKYLCKGGTGSIGANPVIGSTYSWTSSPVGFTSTTSNPQVTPDSTTTYYLTEISASGCTKSDSVTITLLPPLALQIDITDTTLCKGSTVKVTAAATGGNSNYEFFLKKNNITQQSNTTGIFNITANSNEIYTIVLSDNCTTINDSLTCSIKIFSELQFNQTLPDMYLCQGETITLKANTSSGHGTLNYLWTDTLGTILATTDSLFLTPNSSMKIILRVSDDCTSIYDTLLIYEFAFANSTQLTTDVQSGCIPLTVNFETPTLTYSNTLPCEATWDFGEGNTLTQNFTNTSSTLKANYKYISAGVFNVNVEVKFKNSATVCYIFTTTIDALLIPQIKLSIAPKKITLPKTQCTATIVTSNADSVVIDWADGFTDNINTNVNFITQTHDYTDTGHYVVKATAYNKNTCYTETTASVYHADTFMCFIPNAFTPNRDAMNETFKPIVSFCKSYELTIFNRWGEEVYKTKYALGKNLQPVWTGEGCEMDTYIYIFTAVDGDNLRYSFKGTVMLLR